MRTLKKPSLLYVPGSSEKMLGKVADITSGGVVLDLEDAVAPLQKEFARKQVTEFLSAGKQENTWTAVRVNLINSAWGVEDLQAIAPLEPDLIIIPKAREADILTVHILIEGLEEKLGKKLNSALAPLVETAYSVEHITSILASSDRIQAAQFGAEDFTKDMGIGRTKGGAEVAYARQRLAVACRAAGVIAMDSPFTDFEDEIGHAEDCINAREMGYEAKTCIHPKQIETIHKTFLPSEAQIAEAKEIVETFEKAQRGGLGAVSLHGKMLDLPVVERARQIIAKGTHI